MINSEADIIFKIVEPPLNKHCSSGHIAPDTFRRNGPGSPEEPIRFIQVSGKINGLYCEPCIVIANWLAAQRKLSK